jgi:ribonuclease HI
MGLRAQSSPDDLRRSDSPNLTYGAPIWVDVLRKNKNLTKYKRIHRLINIKIAKAYRTIPHDASCVIVGVRPIQITIEQKLQIYAATKLNNPEYDVPLEVRHWRHPAELAIIPEVEYGTRYTTEVYTDSSKIGDNVGAAGIILVNGKLAHQLKFKLHEHCSNNQAEQIAILKVLEKLEGLQVGQDNDKRVAIYTDSRITLDLLQNTLKRNRLIESIRNKMITLTHSQWILHFGWVKGHAGIAGNELVDRFAKAAAVEDGPVLYDEIPREVIITREKENGFQMWRQQWTYAGKGAVTKAFFPSVRIRLRQTIPVFPEFTKMVKGHGKLRSYLYKFGLTDNPMCTCNEEEEQQTTDRLTFPCTKLRNQRKEIIN